jgi:hypothetical protein
MKVTKPDEFVELGTEEILRILKAHIETTLGRQVKIGSPYVSGVRTFSNVINDQEFCLFVRANLQPEEEK